MVAYCKQCGKGYRVDGTSIGRSKICFNFRFFGRLIFAERCEDTPKITGKDKNNPLYSSIANFEHANDCINKNLAL